MNSMTGFGKSEKAVEGRRLRVEIKSVNNRFLDVNIRQPRFLMPYEDTVRQYIKQHLARGRVDVYINYYSERDDAKKAAADFPLILEYIKVGCEIAKKTGITNDLCVSHILRMPEAVSFEEDATDEQAIKELLIQSLDISLSELKKARAEEGGQLKQDIEKRLEKISGFADTISGRAHTVVLEYKQRLTERIRELMEGAAPDEQRMVQEAAIYADKSNITEELVRIRSHVKQFLKLAGSNDAQGRNMDFIVQELNREFNTIGSKSQDVEILNTVLSAKGEVEKIREQIQNIE